MLNKINMYQKLVLILLVCSTLITNQVILGKDKPVNIITAKIRDLNIISIKYDGDAGDVKAKDFKITPDLQIHALNIKNDKIQLETDAVDLSVPYYIEFRDARLPVQPGAVLNSIYSDKELGCFWDQQETFFRLFAPRAKSVNLVLFEKYENEKGAEHDMASIGDGVWQCRLPGFYFGQYYGYRLDRPADKTEQFNPDLLITDPYSKAVATRNEHQHRGKTLILDTSQYDWQGDTPLGHKPEDLIIYECHVRDMTAHLSSGVTPELAGSYKGLLQNNIKGGLEYIKSLGVNAVEFLPIHDFGNMEYPYGKPVNGIMNTWNPYSRNHWGYMTSHFFAPESYYASEQTMEPGSVCGLDGRQVFEFKDVVKALHKENIAVILDVVYNHVSQYDMNALKHIDKNYYFHLYDDQTFCSASGCGNDLRTDRKMSRRLIVDSIKYWMREYHVDGFRFDLAAMIDWETIDEIMTEARKINPNVILIAEPWGGGGYSPAEFSKHGWAAWNDQIRNGVKGQNPVNGQGFIFGKYYENNNLGTIKRYIVGNPAADGGLFKDKSHSVNYLESHDDHTFGDFVRIGLGDVKVEHHVSGTPNEQKLTAKQLAVNKLGALVLFTSQGPLMIHEGQEYARSKVVAPTMVPDSHVGRIDHNSYNKDNETNWLNFEHAELNHELVDYYKGLIRLRTQHAAFRRSKKRDVSFFDHEVPFVLGYLIQKDGSGDKSNFLILINANQHKKAEFTLPSGEWQVVVDAGKAGTETLRNVNKNKIMLEPVSGMVLKQ